jgi:hypothetical protein
MREPDSLDPAYVNRDVVLPYGLTVDEVANGVGETYRLFHTMSEFLVANGFERLESLLLGNSLSGIISEFLVRNIARFSATLVANTKVGGYPDLLLKGRYETIGVLRGEAGIEVKASIQAGGWQGHNPEDCWLMVFRYIAGIQDGADWTPLRFTEILCAELCKDDWSFSGRKGESRRTPTASIRAAGVDKLRSNFLYRIPGVGVGKHRSILAVLPGGITPLEEE